MSRREERSFRVCWFCFVRLVWEGGREVVLVEDWPGLVCLVFGEGIGSVEREFALEA